MHRVPLFFHEPPARPDPRPRADPRLPGSSARSHLSDAPRIVLTMATSPTGPPTTASATSARGRRTVGWDSRPASCGFPGTTPRVDHGQPPAPRAIQPKFGPFAPVCGLAWRVSGLARGEKGLPGSRGFQVRDLGGAGLSRGGWGAPRWGARRPRSASPPRGARGGQGPRPGRRSRAPRPGCPRRRALRRPLRRPLRLIERGFRRNSASDPPRQARISVKTSFDRSGGRNGGRPASHQPARRGGLGACDRGFGLSWCCRARAAGRFRAGGGLGASLAALPPGLVRGWRHWLGRFGPFRAVLVLPGSHCGAPRRLAVPPGSHCGPVPGRRRPWREAGGTRSGGS
jgi:hypothetical protein